MRGRRVLVTGHTRLQGQLAGDVAARARSPGLRPRPASPRRDPAIALLGGRSERSSICAMRRRGLTPSRASSPRSVPSGGATTGAAQLPRAGDDLRHQRHGPRAPARGRARAPGVRVVVATSDKCYLNATRAQGTARATRSAGMTRTARPRPAPRSSRRAIARASSPRATARPWPSPPRGPATSSAGATGRRTGSSPTWSAPHGRAG